MLHDSYPNFRKILSPLRRFRYTNQRTFARRCLFVEHLGGFSMSTTSLLFMDALEPRTLLSGTHHGGRGLSLPPLPANAGPTTTADFNAASSALDDVKTDKTALIADAKALRSALRAARTNLASQLTDLENKAKADAKTCRATIRADLTAIADDFKAIHADLKAGDTAQLLIDQAQLKSDKDTLKTDIADCTATTKADAKAIHDVIYTDIGVKAAADQLVADGATLKADLSAFSTDRATYLKDLKNPTA
jgi:hypothetical protein